MSDRQKGLIDAVTAIPEAEHRYCCFHIENNMIKKFGISQLRGLFWAATETANFNTFKRIMDMIKEFHSETHEWLSNIEFNHWTLIKFDTRAKVEHITNNFVESFNDWIEEHRYKPPVDLLEGLRMQQSAMMYARKKTAERWEHKLTPKVHQKVHELLKKGRRAHVTRVGEEEFQVDYDKKSCIVRLNEWYCICGQWQVRGIPCIHAAACIRKIRANIEDYCSPYFTTEIWRKTFQGVIHPIADESMWPEFDDEELLPPVIKVQPGRPKKHRRRRVPGEERPLPSMIENQPQRLVSSTKKCKNCHEFGHNKRTCKNPSIISQNQPPEGSAQAQVPLEGSSQAQVPPPTGKGRGKTSARGKKDAPTTKSKGRDRGRGIVMGTHSELQVGSLDASLEEMHLSGAPLDIFSTQDT
ncbi:uncharacterized protein LOC133794998 [Humulus lupulus]|uniref:uncharacterized protein LOC133794998 n=1 Tax=Humulus lupulus TaxID=3486 RepID=UPI002B40C62F|nr:uncharacterized protein LOC133794998 [Humulus lupulus]